MEQGGNGPIVWRVANGNEDEFIEVFKFEGILVSQNSWLHRAPHFCATHSSKKRTNDRP